MSIIPLFLVAGHTTWAVNCDACARSALEIVKLEGQKNQTIKLLGRNQEYLAVLSAKEASKFLKVKSNITMTLKKIDALKAQIENEKKNYENAGCPSCKK